MIQLGTRWAFGSKPPARLSPEVATAIATVEDHLRASGRPDLTEAVWTLTWLEGRPTAELDRDGADGEPVIVSVDAAGRVVAPGDEVDDDDAW